MRWFVFGLFVRSFRLYFYLWGCLGGLVVSLVVLLI